MEKANPAFIPCNHLARAAQCGRASGFQAIRRVVGRSVLSDPERLSIDLLRTFEADQMTAWRVTKTVGTVENDRPKLIEAEA